jgi:hypothetical protein
MQDRDVLACDWMLGTVAFEHWLCLRTVHQKANCDFRDRFGLHCF